MRIAITGVSGNGKSTLAAELAERLGIRHVELDALHHGPSWESCGAEVLRERVTAATEGDGWVTDSTYHSMLGDLVLERADVAVWLDLPARVVLWRLLHRTRARIRDRVELWNGNVERSWVEAVRYLIWPAFRGAFANRRTVPERFARHPHLRTYRLRSRREVRDFVQSIQATSSTSGSSGSTERQKTPPLAET